MKNKKNTLATSILAFFFFGLLHSQDVAVAGFNYDAPDGFTLVALVDIPASQNIFVTDAAYQAASNSFDGTGSSNEGTLRITWTGTWTKGTIIEVEETGTSTFTVTTSTNGPGSPAATIVYAGDGFSMSNDGMSVFTASSTADPDNSITEIYSHVTFNSSGANDPNPNDDGDCPCSADFVFVDLAGSGIDYGQFIPANRGNAIALADYNNPVNWLSGTANTNLDLSEFTNLTFGGSGLPVELTFIKAKETEGGALLQWQTASEENNDYFQIEHSKDGRNFNAIDQVLGKGTTVELVDYSYLDSKAASGMNYYRLKQVDYDGQFEYSKVVSVEFRTDELISVYPNPFEHSVTITLESAKETTYSNNSNSNQTIEVFDVLGKLVYSRKLPTRETQIDLNLSELEAGYYFLRTINQLGQPSGSLPFIKR